MFEWFKKFDLWFSKSVCQPIVDKTGVMPRQLTINCLAVIPVLLIINYFLFGLSSAVLIINMLAVGIMVALFAPSHGNVLYESFGKQLFIRFITVSTTIIEICFDIGLWYAFLNKLTPMINSELMVRNTITTIVSLLFLFAVYFSTCKTPPPKKKTESKKISLFKFSTSTT